MTKDAWQPSARRGQPGGAALTGPPTAALTGRAASRAQRRGSAYRFVCLFAFLIRTALFS
jgi:hypothetical protein